MTATHVLSPHGQPRSGQAAGETVATAHLTSRAPGVDGLGDPSRWAGFGNYGAIDLRSDSGGSFGGFGAGGLLGLTGLGAAAAIAASDNDDRVIVVEASPASVLPITN